MKKPGHRGFTSFWLTLSKLGLFCLMRETKRYFFCMESVFQVQNTMQVPITRTFFKGPKLEHFCRRCMMGNPILIAQSCSQDN